MERGIGKRGLVLSIAMLALNGAAAAQTVTGHTLFHPAPQTQLRDMATDRPDTTESPFTVDAGHLQVETNLLGYTRSRPDIDRSITTSYSFASTNLRIGLSGNAEINLVWQPFGIQRIRQRNPVSVQRDSGIGGVDLRAKFNIWGNDTFDKQGSAFAILPYVSLPTDRKNGISPAHVGGGLILPLALRLSETVSLGLNMAAHWVRSDVSSRYHTETAASASLAYAWTEKLGSYHEVAARFNVTDPRGGTVVVLGTGLTYALDRNLQIDAGVNIGLTRSADRVNPFVGISRRF